MKDDFIDKDEIRKLVRKERSAMSEQLRVFSSHKACVHFLKSDLFLGADVILNYMPIKDEADTYRITTASLHEHKTLAFPRCKTDNGDMEFFCIADCIEKKDFDSQFIKNKWGILEPLPLKKALFSCKTFKNRKITVIVPGCAFSARGNRIGWGRGFYDKYLSILKEDAESHDCILNIVGFCFDCQLKSVVPVEPHDVRMDYIVSQSGIISVI